MIDNLEDLIDAKTGALILIDMLFKLKLINKKTYQNIQEKYNRKINKQEVQSS